MSQREHIERTSCSEVLKNLILKTEDTGFEDEKHYWNILNKGFPVYMHMHPCLCAHIYVQSMCVFVQSIGVCLCVPGHACVCARVHIQTCMCVRVCAFPHMCPCMRVCVPVCTYRACTCTESHLRSDRRACQACLSGDPLLEIWL